MRTPRAEQPTARLGLIGSHELLALLRFDYATLSLSPRKAAAQIRTELLDVLVVEHTLEPLDRTWGSQLFDFQRDSELFKVICLAKSVKLPVVVVSRGADIDAAWLVPLAQVGDLVLVPDEQLALELQKSSVQRVQVYGRVFQPKRFNQFVGPGRGSAWRSGAISMQLEDIVQDHSLGERIASLASGDIEIVSRRNQPSTRSALMIDGLKLGKFGAVTPMQRSFLYKTKVALVQLVESEGSKADAVQDAIEAAASGCLVLAYGTLDADDPRGKFAYAFDDLRKLNLFYGRLCLDRLFAKQLRLRSWRMVWRQHNCVGLVERIGTLVDPQPVRRMPFASVVAPTKRPEKFAEIIRTFRSQTWPSRELIVVANTDEPSQWLDQNLALTDSERLLFLPRRFGPGAALNLGFGRARGDYMVRMDDDDVYSRRYIEDNMLVAAEFAPDVMGMADEVYYFVDEGKVVARSGASDIARWYDSSAVMEGAKIAGFSHIVHRDLMSEVGYPHDAANAADTRFLQQSAVGRRELLYLRRADIDAVVSRRSDPTAHTWKNAPDADSRAFHDVNASLRADCDDLLEW